MYYSIFSSVLVSVLMSAGKPFSQAAFKMIQTAAEAGTQYYVQALSSAFAFSSTV